MNKYKLALSIPIAILILVLGVIISSPARTALANPYTATNIQTATTSTAVSVTTSARILATTTNPLGISYTRVYTSICNPNSNPVVLNLNGDKPANLNTGATTIIAAAAGYSVCYEVTDRNMYQGSITASSTNQTATTIFMSDYVQQ